MIIPGVATHTKTAVIPTYIHLLLEEFFLVYIHTQVSSAAKSSRRTFGQTDWQRSQSSKQSREKTEGL